MVEANIVVPTTAEVAPVIAPAEAKTTAPAEVNISAPVGVGLTVPETVPLAEPEATVETPVHPQDVDLGIPHQEVTSAYVRLSAS